MYDLSGGYVRFENCVAATLSETVLLFHAWNNNTPWSEMPKSISSRPSVEQVNCMLEFMEKHPQLGLGKLKGVYGAAESKKLWLQLSRLLNAAPGPNRPVKSWMKYWADKKSVIKSRVARHGGDPSVLSSNLERKIWEGFIVSEVDQDVTLKRSKRDPSMELSDSGDEDNHLEEPFPLVKPMTEFEERQLDIVKRMVNVMDGQATALTLLASSSDAQAQAMNKLADAAQIQALALQALSRSLPAAGGGAGAGAGVRGALADVDVTLKRLYTTMPA